MTTLKQAMHIAAAARLADAAAAYAKVAATKPNTNKAKNAMFDLCNAAIALVDDGDFYAERDIIMDDLAIDEEGYPIDADHRDDEGDYRYEEKRDREAGF